MEIKDCLTLARRNWRIPGVVAIGGLLAHSCAFSNQLVPPVASPAHHAVKMTPGLAHYKAVLWGVWGTAVHRYNRWRNKGAGKRRGDTWQGKGKERQTGERVRMKSKKGKRTSRYKRGKTGEMFREEKRMRGFNRTREKDSGEHFLS